MQRQFDTVEKIRPLTVAFLSPWRHDDPAAWSGMIHRQFQSLSALPGLRLIPWSSADVRPALIDRSLERALGPNLGGNYRAQLGVSTAKRRAARADARVKAEKPDVVLAAVASVDVALMQSPAPVIHVSDATFDLVHDFYPETTGLHPLSTVQARAVDRRLARTVAAHVVSTSWAADGTVAAGANPSDVHVIPFGPRMEPREYVARPPRRHRRILLVASNWERKAGDDVVEAVARARHIAQRPPELTVVGTPNRSLPEWVTCLGRVPPETMPQVYAAHDILVDLAKANAGGVTLTDAHAFGLPTIATDVGGVRDIVDAETTGFLVSPGRAVNEASAALLRLCDDATWHRMSAAAHSRYLQVLNWDTWARETCAVLVDACPRRPL